MQDRYWEPGTQYNYNDVVKYEGRQVAHNYLIVDDHSIRSSLQDRPASSLPGERCLVMQLIGSYLVLPQGDWAPPLTPALWGRLSDDDTGDCQPQGQPQHQHQHQQAPQQVQYQQGEFLSASYYPAYWYDVWQDDKTEQVQAPEKQKHWYGDDETKKKVEVNRIDSFLIGALISQFTIPQIGAGVAAGAALLAGGLFAYKKHEQHKEEVRI